MAGLAIIRGTSSSPVGYWKLVASGSNEILVNLKRGLQITEGTEQQDNIDRVVKYALTSASFDFSLTGGSSFYSLSPDVTERITRIVRKEVSRSESSGCSATCTNPTGIAYVF